MGCELLSCTNGFAAAIEGVQNYCTTPIGWQKVLFQPIETILKWFKEFEYWQEETHPLTARVTHIAGKAYSVIEIGFIFERISEVFKSVVGFLFEQATVGTTYAIAKVVSTVSDIWYSLEECLNLVVHLSERVSHIIKLVGGAVLGVGMCALTFQDGTKIFLIRSARKYLAELEVAVTSQGDLPPMPEMLKRAGWNDRIEELCQSVGSPSSFGLTKDLLNTKETNLWVNVAQWVSLIFLSIVGITSCLVGGSFLFLGIPSAIWALSFSTLALATGIVSGLHEKISLKRALDEVSNTDQPLNDMLELLAPFKK